MGHQRYRLISLIGRDLFAHFKIPMLLLLLNVSTAVAVVYTTQMTRQLMGTREQLTLEKDKLNIEWRNLILEEYVLGDHKRITEIAKQQLMMRDITSNDEHVIIEKNNK